MSDQSATPAPALPPSSDRLSRVLSTITAQARRGLDAVGWADAERTAHQLAGSAGTFGFDGVSVIARSLERFFADAGATGRPDPARLAEARAQLERASSQLADELES